MKNELQLFIEKFQKPLQDYAIAKYRQKDFLASLKICVMESKSLQEAIKTPNGQSSLFAALRYAATTGLSLNPQEGKAALIAYDGKIQYQIMKNGIIELAMKSGKVEFVTADVVHENDIFELEKSGSGDKYKFVPARKNRGNVDGYYAAVKMKNGVTHVMYAEKKEIEEHAKKYSSLFKIKPQASPWSNSFDGMALKTMLKKLFRNITISPELTSAVGGDDEIESGFERDITPEPGMSAAELSEKLDEPEKKPIEAKPDQKTEKKEKDIF